MKPSMKWPAWATLFCFVPFLFAVFFRAPAGILPQSHRYLQGRLLAGLTFSAIVWALYALVYVVCLAMSPSSKQSASVSDVARPIKVNCPKCGRCLHGATTEMVGEVGVCPKCRTEFPITEQQAPST